MHYFSRSGGTGMDMTKTAGTCYAEPVFCIKWELRVTLCIPVSLRHVTSTHYFSGLGGTGTDMTKSALGHVTPNFVFLHPLESTGNIVHSGASGA
jgi:hypothetical protein